MKKIVIAVVVGIVISVSAKMIAAAKSAGETAHPVAKRTYTYE